MEVSLIATEPLQLPEATRAPGCHVSDIIRGMCIEAGHFEDKPITRATTQLWEVGRLIEEGLTGRYEVLYPGRFVKPGELTLDNIHLNPDLVDTLDWVVHEMKCTWMSINRGPDDEKFWKYETQLKAYCKVLDTRTGVLEVVFVNSDYRDGSDRYRKWRMDFTQWELDENWAMLRSWGTENGLL